MGVAVDSLLLATCTPYTIYYVLCYQINLTTTGLLQNLRALHAKNRWEGGLGTSPYTHDRSI